MAISQILPLTFCLPATGFSNYDAANTPVKKQEGPDKFSGYGRA